MTVSRPSESAESYDIRPYEYDDASDVIALYESIWGAAVDETWLHHRFIANPFVDHTTMIVADSGEEVVGARPYVAHPVRSNGERRLALLLNDLMVHPDHRRRGLFTRMTERVIEDNSDDAAVTVNFANDLSAPGYRKMGFDEIGTGLHKDVRLQRPGAFIRERTGGVTGSVAATVADLGIATYQQARRVARPHIDVEVERYRGIPADRLRGLDTGATEGIHTARTTPVYRWLAADPRWRHWTYIAENGAEEAALVVKERVDDNDGCWIGDALPLDGSSVDTLAGLLEVVVRDFRDAPQISVTGPIVYERLLPPALLRRYGFHASVNPLFARLAATPDTVFVNYLGDGPPVIGGLDVRDPGSWTARIR